MPGTLRYGIEARNLWFSVLALQKKCGFDPLVCDELMTRGWQVGAREDSWPLENVSKVSVITGEFNGHSVSGLIHYCWTYFFITMGFDLLQAFVVENIQVKLARSRRFTHCVRIWARAGCESCSSHRADALSPVGICPVGARGKRELLVA